MAKRNPNWRQDVADEMIRQIEAGTAPWQKPWIAGVIGHQPHNGSSGTPYHGINALWLEMQGHEDPRWMTLRQANAVDASIRQGEKSTLVEYWMWTHSRPMIGDDGAPVMDENGKPKKEPVRLDRPKVFYANVFNAEQIDGLKQYQAPAPKFEPMQEAERLLNLSGIKISHDQNDRAFYQPSRDQIHLPAKTAFPDAYEYYATALHELGHATGHKSRLARDFGPFGSEVYAKEELRAEMTSYMLARELGLGHNPERHAPYVENWLKAVKEDHNILFQAARDANHMATWIKEPDLRKKLEHAAQQKKEGKKMDRTAEQSTKPVQDKSKRTYLSVPFAEKDQAKAAGAKWDRTRKSWFAPESVDLAQFEKWKLKNQPMPEKKPDLDPVKEFADELKKHGVAIKGHPMMDGKWHRAAFEDDEKGKQNASYRAFLDGRPNGQIKNYKTAELVKWVARGEALSPKDHLKLEAEAAEVREKRAAERQKLQNEARLVAMQRFDVGKVPEIDNENWIKGYHESVVELRDMPYLARKNVWAYGIHELSSNLLVPARDIDGKLWSVQTIQHDGTKRFQKNARKVGLMHVIDPKGRIGEKPVKSQALGKGTIIIAEGYATAASVHEATQRPTIVAFDAGNLKPVAEAVRKQYPHAKIVIAADNDHTLEHKPYGNVGKNKATEAALAVGGFVVAPGFDDEQKAKGLSDWNDLAQANGSKAIVEQMRQQLKRQRAVQKGEKPKRAALEM